MPFEVAGNTFSVPDIDGLVLNTGGELLVVSQAEVNLDVDAGAGCCQNVARGVKTSRRLVAVALYRMARRCRVVDDHAVLHFGFVLCRCSTRVSSPFRLRRRRWREVDIDPARLWLGLAEVGGDRRQDAPYTRNNLPCLRRWRRMLECRRDGVQRYGSR